MQKIAVRYAKALFRLAKSQAEKELFYKHLTYFKDWMVGSSNFRNLFNNLFIPAEVATIVLTEICDKSKLSPVITSFLHHIIDQKRLSLFPAMIEAYCDLYQGENNIRTGDVETANRLNKELEESFTKHLETHFKTNLILKFRVNKSLLGGFRAQVGSHQMDASLLTQLSYLNRTLKRAS